MNQPLTAKDFFFCYSPNLNRHIRASKLRFICTGISETTGKTFWMYEKSMVLEYVLKQYTAGRAAYLESRKPEVSE